MYEYLKALYLSGALSLTGLETAVNKWKWITAQQAGIIKGLKTKQDEANNPAPTPEPTPDPEPAETEPVQDAEPTDKS
jgi:hypothetical protein